MRTLLVIVLATIACFAFAGPNDLKRKFADPPDSARPWVYWFWLNGNVTREGITADMEAMKRVGIGGVLIMETDQGTPAGPVAFASPRWRELFHHVLQEARRLGLQVSMNDDAGWTGSGGPWIKPEQSMQKVVATETAVSGPRDVTISLKQPETVAGYYRDITVLAYPTPTSDYRIPDIQGRSGLLRQEFASTSNYGEEPQGAAIDPSKIQLITGKMDSSGRLSWSVPAGNWTLMRVGHTSTGAVNEPAPKSGEGLECDKLSAAGAEAAFDGFVGKLVAASKPFIGTTFVRTNIDSWEVGSQNWTALFAQEFKRRRGYDLTPYFPVLSGRVVGNLEMSQRFLWDIRETISELLIDNYAGHMRELAKRSGLDLSIEGYGNGCVDDLSYAGRAGEPMSEFWSWPGGMNSPESRTEPFIFEMASAAHVYGKPILGAESFTSTDFERWLYSPRDLKGLGDWELSRGVNRFVFHRYAMQPWLQVKPGMSMGPWGLHYERTQTWWKQSGPWHQYLSRCQFLLRQGDPVVDVLYLAPEGAPSSFTPPRSARAGPYQCDACPPDALLNLASARGGQIVFQGGMTYRALVLPPVEAMTPTMLAKIKSLADAGATIIGTVKPRESPSLAGFPAVDAQVQKMADDLWASGKVISNQTVEAALASQKVDPDFQSAPGLSAEHRQVGAMDIYFVANPTGHAVNSHCWFRVARKAPEFWNAETGEIGQAALYATNRARTDVPLSLGSHDSVFVVFTPGGGIGDPIVSLAEDGKDPFASSAPKVTVDVASWGPAGDSKRTKDVKAQVQGMVDAGVTEFRVCDLVDEGDPAPNVVKTLDLKYEIEGKIYEAKATDPETVTFAIPPVESPGARLAASPDGSVHLIAHKPGAYQSRTLSGRILSTTVPPSGPIPILGPWQVAFPRRSQEPTQVAFPQLISWSGSSDPFIRYFSGTALYRTTIDIQKPSAAGERQILDLGQVEVDARINLNGHELGVLWRSPYRADVTGILHPGANQLDVWVTNLWPNRMIGDEMLPEDSDRNANGTLKRWPEWLLLGEPSPTGRSTFSSWKLWKKDEKLLPSGLLGPVTILTEIDRRLR